MQSYTLDVRLQLLAMAANNDAERAAGPEKRLAENGRPYTRIQSARELRLADAADFSSWRGAPAGGNAAQLPDSSRTTAVIERRLANDGLPYTRRDFLEFYGIWGEHRWANAKPFMAIHNRGIIRTVLDNVDPSSSENAS